MSAAPPDPPVVAVQSLSKDFRLPHEQVNTLKERAMHPFRRRGFEQLHGLQDISFEVHEGEFFGVVGRNGSGKSTLMKCLAGIYRADRGTIHLRGRMAPFIELGVGFNPELPARDNVFINAIMLGLTPAQARQRFDAIIDYAELEGFMDLRLKNYSSGMQVRLAFAVMVQVDADVLLIDEVLAVGDAAFQQKCYQTLEDRRRDGKTILFVTHDMNTVEQVCDRAMLLDEGRMVDLSEPRSIARQYSALNFGHAVEEVRAEGGRTGDGAAAIVDAWVEDSGGRRVPVLEQGATASFCMEVELRDAASEPSFGFSIVDEHHRRVFVAGTAQSGTPTGDFAAGERVRVRLAFDNVLAPGRYFATPEVAHHGVVADVMDSRHELLSVVVHGGRTDGGLISLPHEISLERTGAATAVE